MDYEKLKQWIPVALIFFTLLLSAWLFYSWHPLGALVLLAVGLVIYLSMTSGLDILGVLKKFIPWLK